MISILYDYQILVRQKFGGISRYFYEIINRLENRVDINIRAIHSQNYYFTNYLKEYTYKNGLQKYIFRIINAIVTRLYLLIGSNKIDIIHPTYYVNYGKWIKRKNIRNVVTVHDMIHEIYWGDTTSIGKKFVIACKKKSILNADYIITVSQNTKKDLLKYYPDLNADNIAVIYHGYNDYSDIPFDNMKENYGRYILFVGNRNDYKNFRSFIIAMKKISTLDSDVKVVCVGGGSLSNDEIDLINECNMTGRIFQVSASDRELVNLYRGALFFIFPSLYEGFGIPILEAFACDCPVLLSNCSCFPEIGGDAVEYFEESNIESLENKIELLLANEGLRTELSNKGRKRMLQFSWDVAADKTYEIYKNLYEKKM